MKAWKLVKKDKGTVREHSITLKVTMYLVLIVAVWIFFKAITSV
jgi:hypothetical protein